MNTEAKITCKTCGITDVPDWNGEGDCITCARDKVLNTEALDTPPQSPNNGEVKPEPSHDGGDTLDEILYKVSNNYNGSVHISEVMGTAEAKAKILAWRDSECLKARIDERRQAKRMSREITVKKSEYIAVEIDWWLRRAYRLREELRQAELNTGGIKDE